MKIMMKRTFAWVMVLALCLSLLPGVKFTADAATVDYVYAGKYIKNWGTRGTTATFLSPNAEAFYQDNNTSYDELARLSGSASTGSVPSSALYRQLQDLMKSNHSTQTSYEATKDLYQYTDCQNSGKTSSKISSFYSGMDIGPAWDGGSTWNREHTWPNSKGLEGRDEDDIMMLRPTAKSENSSRGNTAYGESSNYYDPNQYGMSLHGDVARIMLYQYVRWGNTSMMWGSSGVMESREVLLKWVEEDPVDTWELGRNDSVESITGTRNVFVDYPELAFVLLGADIPEDYITPSGSASSSSYTITATSNNTDWGTVSVSGRTINATPKTGYAVSGYTVVSGTAQITQTGNSFIVSTVSDVKIQINFVARTQNTVRFSQRGSIVDTETAYTGDTITLPAHSGPVENNHTFIGWMEYALAETDAIPTFYTVGSQYTVTGERTLHALYTRLESGSGNTSNVFERYSGALTEGDYVIVGGGSDGDCAMVAADTGKTRLQYKEITYTNGDILSPTADTVWHIGKDGAYWTIYNAATGKYAGSSGSKNQAKLLDSVNDAARWTATGTSTYELKNKANSSNNINANLRRNGNVGFACYSTATGQALKLYKRISGTVYYFTGAVSNSPADLNNNGIVDEDDAIYLLRLVVMGDYETIHQGMDFDGDGDVTEDDAVYLLRHVLMGDSYPIS